jgi:hypothetical protein
VSVYAGTRKVTLRGVDVDELWSICADVTSLLPYANERRLLACTDCRQACMAERKCACCRRSVNGTDPNSFHAPLSAAPSGDPITFGAFVARFGDVRSTA